MRCCNFFLKYGIYIAALIYLANLILIFITPITPSEVNILFAKEDKFLIDIFLAKELFKLTHNYIIVRLFFYFISLLNLYLFFLILKEKFTKGELNFFFFLYSLIPGVMVSSILINKGVLAIFFTLLLIFSLKKRNFYLEVLSLAAIFLTTGGVFAIYFALAWYSYDKREYKSFTLALIFMLLSAIFARYPIDGVPRNHFKELIGSYAAILSPLLFLGYVYAIYRKLIDKRYDIFWYIGIVTFIISVVLSMRQKVLVIDFGPYIILSTPIIVEVFFSSIQVRLKRFQKKHCILCYIVIFSLIFMAFLLFFHKPLYVLLNRPKKFIGSEIYVISDEAKRFQEGIFDCKRKIPKRYRAIYRYYKIPICK